MLGMHMVLLYLVRFHRAEGAKTNMESDLRDRSAALTDLLKKLLGKMKSCGRSGGRAVEPGVDRVVAGSVRQAMSDVGGQGHLAETVKNLLEYSVIGEADTPVAFINYIYHLAGQDAASE